MRASIGRNLASDDITKAQIERLARNLIDRSPDELSGIAESNPALVREWVTEMRQRREVLEAEVLALDAALHRLLSVRTSRGRTAA